MSGHGKKPTERGELTSWRRQREGLVRTQKETNQARGTDALETASGGDCQDTERNRPTEGHSQAEDGIGRGLLGHEKEPTERGALTNWRRHREGLVRTRKEIDRARGTHSLKTAEGRTCQDTERKQHSENSPVLTLCQWRPQGKGHPRTWIESDLARGMSRGSQREGLVRT
jgi:hypothetical protein